MKKLNCGSIIRSNGLYITDCFDDVSRAHEWKHTSDECFFLFIGSFEFDSTLVVYDGRIVVVPCVSPENFGDNIFI